RPSEIHFQSGDPVGVNGKSLSASAVLETLDQIGRRHGIGRLDIVENRIFGMKHPQHLRAPSGSLLWHAHRAVESLVLDPEVAQLKEELMPKYSALVYRGLWFAPERLMLQTAIDFSQQNVTGDAILRAAPGAVQVIGRRSPHSRYDTAFATFEAEDVFDQRDSSGWLRVNTVRFRAGLTNGTATP
ncbi:argininosuccinate synthase, partial [Salinispora arenicola]